MNLNAVHLNGSPITPTKIVCIGRNYVEHIEELGNPVPERMVVFMKPNSSITERLQSFPDEPVNYEAEISFLVMDGRLQAVAAGLDLTKRDLQNELKAQGLPWERAKAFDGAALFSPFVALGEIGDSLTVELTINDQLVQQGSVALMIYKPERIIEECRRFISFNDGDIIMTGTPKGVGLVRKGDVFKVRIVDHDQLLTRAEWQAT